MERDVDARRSVASSGMIVRGSDRHAPVISLSLILVLIKGLSRRRFYVLVFWEEREEMCRTAFSRLD